MSATIDPVKAKLETKFWELTNPANPAKHNEEKAIDVVAVHGLNGQPHAAHWENEDGSMWLCDLLPKDIRHVRVFALAYDPKELLVGSNYAADSLAQFLLARLWVAREDDPKPRPLVFLAHGFGGFVVEKAINYLTESRTDLAALTPCIKKVIFLSTPQRAPDEIEWNSLLGNCMADCMDWRAPFFSQPVDEILELLRENKAFLQEVTTEFKKNVARLKIKIFSCYEEVPTPPLEKCSVNETNATLDLKLEKLRAMPGCNHISIAKYSRREDENYQAIMLAIKKVLRSASAEKPATKVTKGPSQVSISVTIQPSIPPGTKKPVKGFSEVGANTHVAPAFAVKPPELQARRQHSAPVVARDGSDPAQSIPKMAPSPAELPQSAPSAGSLPQPPDRNKSITRRHPQTSVLVGPSARQLSTSAISGKGNIASQELPTSLPDQSNPHMQEPKRPNELLDSVPPAKRQELDQGGLKGPGHSKQSVGITPQALSGSREGSTKGKHPQVAVAPPSTTRHELDSTLPQKLGPAAGLPPPAQGPSQKTTSGVIQSIPTHDSTTTGGPASMGPGVPQQASTGSRELPTQSKPPLASPPQQPPLSSLAAGENVQQPQPLGGPRVQNTPNRTSNVGHGPAHTGPAVAKAPQQVKPKPVPLTASPPHSSGTVEKGAPSHTSTKIHVEQKVTTGSSNVVHGPSTGPAVPHPPSGTRQPLFQGMPPPQNVHSAFSAPTGQPDKPQVPLKMSSPKGPISAPTAPHGTSQATPLITKQAHSGARELPPQASLPTAQKPPLHSPATAPQAHVSGSFNSFIQNISVHATSQSIHTQVDPKIGRGSPEHGHLPSKPSPIPPQRSSIHGPTPPSSAKHGPATGGSQGYTAFKPFTETQTTSHMPPKGPIPFRPGLVQHSHSTSDVLTTSSVMAQGHSTSAGVPTHSGHRHSIAALPSILSSGPTASKGVPSSPYAQPQQPSPTQTQSKTPPSLFPASLRVHAKPAPFAPSIAKSVPMHSDFAQTSSAHMPPAQPSRPPPGPAAPMPHSGSAKPPSRPSSMSGPPGGLFRGKHSAPAPSGGPLARPPMTTAATQPPSGPPHRPSGNAPPRPFTLSDPPSVRPGVQPTAAITGGHPPSRPALSGHSSQPPSGPPGRPTGTVPYRPFTMSGPPVATPPKPPGLVAGLAPGSEGAPGPGPSAKPPYRPYSISGPPSNLLPGGRGGPPPLLTRKQRPPSLMSGAPVPRPPALNAGPPKSAVPPNRHSISGPPPHSLPKGLQPGPAPLAKPGFLRSLFGANQPGPRKPQPSSPAQGRPPLGKPPPPRPGPGGRPPGAKPPPTGPPAGMKPGGPPKPPGPKPTLGGGYQPYRGPQGPSGKPPGSRPSGATPPHAGPPKPGPGGKPSGHHGPHLGPAHGPHHGPHHGGHHGPHHGSHHGPDHGHGPGHGHGWFDWLHAGQHRPPGANVLVDPAHHPPETKPEETKPPETQPEETKPTDTKPEGSKPPASGTEETKPTAETKPEETKPPGSPIAETKPEDEGKLTGTESGPGIQATETESEGENKPEKPGSNTAGAEQKPQDGNNVLGTETSPSEQGSQPTAAEGSPSNDNKPVGPSVPGTDTSTGVDPTSINTSSGGPGSQYVNQVPVSLTAGQESTTPVKGDRSLHTDSAPHFTFIQAQSQSLYNMYAPYQPASTEQAMATEPETSRSLTDNTPNLGVVHPQTVYNAYPGSGDTPFPENAGQTPPSDTTPRFEFVQPQTVYKACPSTSSEALSQPASGAGQQYGFVQPQTVHDAPSAQETPGFPNSDNQHLEDPHSVVPPPRRPTHTAVFPDIKDARPLSTSVSEGSYHFGFTESQTGTPAGPEQSFLGSHQTAGQSTSGYEQPGPQGQNTTRPPPVLPIHTAVFPDVATIPSPKSSEPNSSQDSPHLVFTQPQTASPDATYRQHGSQGEDNVQPPPVLPTHTPVFPDFASAHPPTTSESDDSPRPGFQHETVRSGQGRPYVAFQPPSVQANAAQTHSEPESQSNTVAPPVRPMHTSVFPDFRESNPPASPGLGSSSHLGFTAPQSGYTAYSSPQAEPSAAGASTKQHQAPYQPQCGVAPDEGNKHEPGTPGDSSQSPPVLQTHTAIFTGFQNRDILQSSGTSHSPQQQDKKEPNAPTGQRTGGAGDIGHDPSDDPAQKADIVGDEGPRNFLGIYYPGEQAAGQSLKAQTVDTHAGLGDGLGLQNKSLGMGPSQADATRGDPAAGHQYTAFFQSSPSLASHGINTPQTSSTIPYQARDISFGAQTTTSPLNPAVSTTTSPPGEAATYYDSFEKPNPFPATNPQPTQPPFQAYQPYTSQAQPYQAQSPQPAPYTPYTPNQEQKKISSGTGLKVAAGVVAGAAVAGLATAGIMHALDDHDDSKADPTSSQTDASANAFPRDLSGAPGPQVEAASVSDLDDSDAYASTVDSSDLKSIDAGSEHDLERSIHAEAQHVSSQDAEPSSAETPGVPFVGATPAPNPFDDNEDSDHHHDHSHDSVADSSDLDSDDGHSDIESIVNIDHQQESARAVGIEPDSHDPLQEPQMAPAAAQFTYPPADQEYHDFHQDNSSVVDSSGLDTDDAHTDGGESEHDGLSRDLNFDTQAHGQYADHDIAGNQYLNESYFAHADAERPADSTNVSDPNVSDSDEHGQDHDVPDSDNQSVSDSNYSGHRDIDGGHSEPGQGIEEQGYQDLGHQYDTAGFDDTQYDSDYEQHLQRDMEDIDEQHASDDQHDSDEHVEHGVEASDAGDDSDEHHGEMGSHTGYPYQGQDSDQEHNDKDSEVAGDEPPSQPGYWHVDDDEVASPATQHPSGYWEGDDEEDENDTNQRPAGYWEGDDDDDEANETNANQYPQGYWQGDNGEENDDDDDDSDDGNEMDGDDSEDGEDNEDEVNTTQYPQGYWQGDDGDEDGEDDDSENDVEATDEDEGEDEDGVPQSPAGYWQGNDEDEGNEDDSDDDENDDDVDEDESHYQNQYQQDSDDDEDDEDDDDDDDDDDEDEEPANAYQTQYYDQSQYQDYGGGADEDDDEDDDEDEDEDQGPYQQYQADYSQEYQQEYPQQEYVQQEYQQEYYEPEPVYQEQYQEPEPVYQQDYQQEYQAEPVYQQEYYEPEPVYQQEYQQEYHEPEPVYQQEPVYYEEQANYDYSGGYEEAEYDYGGGYDEGGYDAGDYYEEY